MSHQCFVCVCLSTFMFRGIAAPRVFKMFLRFLFSFLQEKRKQYRHQGQLVYEWDQSLDEVFFFFPWIFYEVNIARRPESMKTK